MRSRVTSVKIEVSPGGRVLEMMNEVLLLRSKMKRSRDPFAVEVNGKKLGPRKLRRSLSM